MEEERGIQLQKIAENILAGARAELCLYMRFLNLPLSSLTLTSRPGTMLLGTDGTGLYYDPKVVMDCFLVNPILINRSYLHEVLHCIFRHLYKPHQENRAVWDLACDIALEYMIDSINYRCVRYPASRYRLVFYENLKHKFKVPTAEKIFGLLSELDMTPNELEQLEAEFRKDDHSLWPDGNSRPESQIEAAEQKWKDISEKMQTEMETLSNEDSEGTESLMEEIKVENRRSYDYRSFLKKFAVLKEVAAVDPDSFDPILYTYGLNTYGNMPLIEPQETMEAKKIEEIVLAIDTSLSCSGELVREFLMQTYRILKETESFFRKINIHIIQCDEEIRIDRRIGSQEELKEYMEHFELIGNGGTDFRPVFEYVDNLIKQKVFKNLRGLIYFTDGQGTFPGRRPTYDTAFAFLRENYEDAHVPPWAMKLIIEPEDLVNIKKSGSNQ